LVDALAPAGAVTAAYTWLSTGIAGLLALGAVLAGALAEADGAGAAFAAAAAASAAAALAALLRGGTLLPARGG
jgi:hypothetical protein